MINKKIIEAIFKLYPEVVLIRGDVAYDANENEIEYDLQTVTEQAEIDAQAVIDAKQAAHDKLTALGLTAEEIAALGK